MRYSRKHIPVLLNEVLKFLNPQPNQNFIDCTVGTGGHAQAILSLTGSRGRLLGIDKDEIAVKESEKNLKQYKSRCILTKNNFVDLKNIALKYGFKKVDGILFDLGMSSIQLLDPSRGFSFLQDGPLDMRMDKESELTASDIINNWSQEDLARIFRQYSQERYARKIAKAIVKEREKEPIFRTLQLVEIINKVKPRTREKIHPATKIFQALRIAVNNELENLKKVLPDCLEILKSKGKIAVISFHSKEDAIVKKFFVREAKDCICPIKQPICTCGHKAQLIILTKKPIIAGEQEIKQNPQSRSAKLRVAQKI